MADLDRVIQQAISKGIAQRLTGTLETYVRNEVLRYLSRYNINPASLKNSKKISLVEGQNLKKKIGSLVIQRVKNGVAEGLRFKLNGLQARTPADAIDKNELQRIIKKAIQERLKHMR